MRLTHLQADGLKNAHGVDVRVPPLWAIAGPNGSGKTTLIQALKLALLGHDPELGKTLASVRQLAGGRGEIAVSVAFDSGFGVHRAFGRSLTTEVAPEEGESTEAERQARIVEETGAFVLSFDLHSFLNLSTEKRRAALFSLLPRELVALDQERFRSALGYEDVTAGLQKAIDNLWQDHVKEEASPVDGLAAAIEYARLRANEAESKRQDQTKVVERLAQTAVALEAEIGEEGPSGLPRLQAELAVVNEQLGAARAASQRAQAEERRRAVDAERFRVLRTDAIPAAEARVARLASEAEEEGEDEPIPTTTGIEKIRAEVEQSRSTAGEAARTSVQATALLSGTRSTMVRLDQEIRALGEGESCPTCGSDLVVEARARLLKAHQELAERERTEAAEAERLERDARAATAAYDQLREAFHAAERKNAAGVEESRQRAARRLQLQRERSDAEERLGMLRADLKRLEGAEYSTSEADPEKERRLEAEAARLSAEIAAEQEKLKRVSRLEAHETLLSSEQTELANREWRAKVLADVLADLRTLRGEVIREMVGPVEETANELLQVIDPAKTFRFLFEREGKEHFDFGFEQAGAFRSFDAASTGEDAFLAVVFVAALIGAVRPAWRVLLVDNAEAVDDQRREALMEALSANAHLVDNVILAGCCTFPEWTGFEVTDVRELIPAAAGAS